MGYSPGPPRKRFFAPLLALLISAIFLSSAAFGEERVHCLRLGMDEWPPYEYEVDGHMLGMSTDIVTRVLASMGACVESLDIFPWVRGLRRLQSGELDVLFSADYRPERLDWAFYPEEALLRSGWVVYVRADDERYRDAESLEDIPGAVVGTVIGFAYPFRLTHFLDHNATGVPVSADELNFRKLVAGRVDALVCDRYNGLYLVRETGLKGKVRALSEEIAGSKLYPIFSRASVSRDFVERFSSELAAFKKTEEYRRIMMRWVEE